MTGQAELNCLLIDNLADLEAAGHQIDERLTPMIVEAAGDLVGTAVDAAGWDGDAVDFDHLWFAPKAWHEPGAAERDYLCRWEYRPTSADDDDWFLLSALLGAGVLSAGFYLNRRYGGGTIAWSKLLAAHKESVAELEQAGVFYDREDRTFYIPIKLDADALKTGLHDGSIEAALAPFGRAVTIAQAAEHHLKPIVDAMRDEAMK